MQWKNNNRQAILCVDLIAQGVAVISIQLAFPAEKWYNRNNKYFQWRQTVWAYTSVSLVNNSYKEMVLCLEYFLENTLKKYTILRSIMQISMMIKTLLKSILFTLFSPYYFTIPFPLVWDIRSTVSIWRGTFWFSRYHGISSWYAYFNASQTKVVQLVLSSE